MATIALISPRSLSGKTTVAAALARIVGGAVLKRAGSDANATADSELFATLSTSGAKHTIVESPAGETAAGAGALAVAVASGDAPVGEIADFCKQAGNVTGVVVNRMPLKRAKKLSEAYTAAGLKVLAWVPEDRVLAAPLLRDVIAGLEAEASHVSNGAGNAVIENPVIASISADPGQGYFLREAPSAVIVRSDKPDLQLAAINAGAPALIVTGGLPILRYVLERAESDEIPLLRTALDTVQAVDAIEALFAARPFAGGDLKLRRAEGLLSAADLSALLG
jgi:BioD-like phosphotransacetylase family protein